MKQICEVDRHHRKGPLQKSLMKKPAATVARKNSLRLHEEETMRRAKLKREPVLLVVPDSGIINCYTIQVQKNKDIIFMLIMFIPSFLSIPLFLSHCRHRRM